MQEKNPPSDVRQSLIKYAANILSRRPYFSSALKKKMTDRALHLGLADFDSEIEGIIKDLSNNGYLDDQYLSEAYVRKELHKGWGPRIINLKMRRLGIDQGLIISAINQEAGLQAQIEAIHHYSAKLKRYDQRVKINKFFQRGFNGPAIFKAFDSAPPAD